jgi:hypothetical protein
LTVIDRSPRARCSRVAEDKLQYSPAIDEATSPSVDRARGTAVDVMASELVEEPSEADEGLDV